ncbi:MAG: aspartate kinase, partial [Bacillota bacterium]|nr:aspartate kinase [Bacillota bacterium]
YLCHGHVAQGIPFDDVFNVISKRYLELAEELSVSINVASYLIEIKKNIEAGATADYTASRGEYLNGLILADYLNFKFVDAAEVIFFDKYGNLDSEKTQDVINKRLSNIENAVIPGFYGSTYNGFLKTFSRGGSDITGAIVARGVNASLYENWTDVSGFLMADPRIVENPKPIEKITYRELRELSYMGATVLHEDAIFPVRKAGIPINIKNTNIPSDPGTLIINDLEPTAYGGTITGVAGKKDFTVIAIEKAMLNAELGIGRKLLTILEAHSVSFENMPSGIDSICLVIEDSQLENKLDLIIDDIKRQCKPDSIDVYPNMALIATVGRGMLKTKGIAGKIFKSLADNDINIRMIDQGSSEINIIIGVENIDFENAIKSIYNAFAG